MRPVVLGLGTAAAIALAASSVIAAPGLRGIMHAWRDDARDTRDMLDGRSAFNAAALRERLQGFAADAGRVAGGVTARTSSARDFQRRFVAFRAEAQAALADLGQRSALQADFSRLMSDCKACHDIYNN